MNSRKPRAGALWLSTLGDEVDHHQLVACQIPRLQKARVFDEVHVIVLLALPYVDGQARRSRCVRLDDGCVRGNIFGVKALGMDRNLRLSRQWNILHPNRQARQQILRPILVAIGRRMARGVHEERLEMPREKSESSDVWSRCHGPAVKLKIGARVLNIFHWQPAENDWS